MKAFILPLLKILELFQDYLRIYYLINEAVEKKYLAYKYKL
jgi:hypothetical protein